MIDDDDKLRRNVVVFSATILAITFLDLPIGSVSAKFLGGEGTTVSAFRIWLMALLVLFYLVIRFSFPDKPSELKPVPDWKHHFTDRRREALDKLVALHFQERTKELQQHPVQTYIPRDLLPRHSPPQPRGVVRPEGGLWNLVALDPHPGKYWSGTLIIDLRIFPNQTVHVPDHHEVREPFHVWLPLAVFLDFRAAFLSTLYSSTAANWLFPRALAVLATACISVKLVHTW